MSNVEQFGKFLLLEKLASGGMAEIYLAKSIGASGVNKFLAIKRILPQYSENTEFINMFKEEAKIAVNLNHSNVVTINEFGFEKNQFYLVMEYVEGKNLRQINNDLRKLNLELSLEQIIFIVKEVAAGLDYAHRCIDGTTGKPLNITHRDMSPQNIMISFEGDIKVIDFGIAKAETQLEATKAGTLKGKFGYMSPEQAEGYPIDSRTDIFSLGIILWELLAQERLFSGGNEAAILRKIRDCQVPPISKFNPSVPRELEGIVLKALAKDKSLRYQKASDLYKDLNRFLNTNYPEFSGSDLSLFFKQAFSENYSEQRNKLIQYSKVQAVHSEEKIKVRKTSNEETLIEQNNHDHEEALVAPAGILNQTATQNSEILKQSITNINNSKYGTKSVISSRPINGNSGSFTTRTNIQRLPPSKNENSKILQFLILVVVGLSGWLGYKEIYLKKMGKLELGSQQKTEPSLPPVKPVVTTKSVEVTDITKVMINSNPSNAQIYIDDKSTDQVTPYLLSLTTDKEVKIKLIKEGYITYEAYWTPLTQGNSFNGTLQPYPKVAYVSIDILSGGGANPKLEINGQILSEKPPISRYTIPADIPVKIKATNPYTGATATKVITVNPFLKEHVELMLGFDEPGK